MIRLIVRTQPAHGIAPRYRAGLGPFGREPVTVEALPWQAAALKADPQLLVAEVGVGPEAADAAPKTPSGADMPRSRVKTASGASKG